MQRNVFFDILDGMTCLSGLRNERISEWNIEGQSRSEVESLCRNDANCVAYDYGYGRFGQLCSSTLKTEDENYVICSKGIITHVFA